MMAVAVPFRKHLTCEHDGCSSVMMTVVVPFRKHLTREHDGCSITWL